MGAGGGRRERGGGAARPLLEGSPGLVAAARASQCGSRLARAAPGLGRPLGLCGRLPLPRPLRGPRAQRLRSPLEGGGAGSPRRSRGRRQPAAAGRPPGRGKAGIWRPLPAFPPTGPGARPRPSGEPRDPPPRAPARLAPGARAPGSRAARPCSRSPSAAASGFFPVPVSKSPFGQKVSRVTSDPGSVVGNKIHSIGERDREREWKQVGDGAAGGLIGEMFHRDPGHRNLNPEQKM